MDAQDRISDGWQVWLTPRQTRIIHDALAEYDPNAGEIEHCEKLREWFGAEVDAKFSESSTPARGPVRR